ncbi:MAG TPA: glycosyltransferase family 4 protein [Armatimonadota bacterium]
MKVLLGTGLGFLGVGGLGSYTRTLSAGLAHLQVENRLVYPPPYSVFDRYIAGIQACGNLDRARVALTRLRTKRVARMARELLRADGDFTLIHTQDVLLARSMADCGLPLVTTVHGPLSREARMLGRGSRDYLRYLETAEREAYHAARAIIAVDTGQKEIVVNDFQVPPEKVHVVLNAVNTDIFAPTRPTAPIRERYLLVPRRLVRKNGVHVAIRALGALSNATVNLWIAGDGPERKALEALVTDLRLQGRVRFLGDVPREAMINLLNSASGVIIPSVPADGVIEASSIAALEGMAMGKPVYASNIGGLAEMIRHGDTGWLFPAGKDAMLADLLRQHLDDRKSSQMMGGRARAYVIAHHSLPVWLNAIMGVYQHACS